MESKSKHGALHGKLYFLFPDVLIFLALSEKIMFLFPENIILRLGGKSKMVFPKNVHGNMIFSSNFLKIWSFQKGPHRDMIFLVLSGKMVFFPGKHDIFSLGH